MIVQSVLAVFVAAAESGGGSSNSAISWVDYAAVGIAALAFLFSCGLGLSNRRTARKALALSERQEARRESELDLYLFTPTARRRESTGDRVLEFHIQV